MSRLTRLIGEVHRRSLWQVLLIYVGGAWACYELIDNITSRFGLPEWLPAAAAILFLLGLPFVLATAYVQEGTPLEGPVDTTLIPEHSDPGRARHPTSGARRLWHGHPQAADAALRRALDWLASRPPGEAETPGHRYDLARVLYWSGRWDDALPLFEALTNEQPTSQGRLGFLGSTLARLGRRDEALRVAERLRALDQPYLRGANTAGRAHIMAVLGDSADAVRLLRQAYREGQYFDLQVHREPDFETLREYPPFVDLVGPRG